MSNAPSGSQSTGELKTARTLNTVATIGAGHAIYASIPKSAKSKMPGHKKLVEAGWLNEPVEHVRRPLPPKLRKLASKMPKAGTSAKIAAGAAAGGWLTLHSGELAGDVMARRSINNQLKQKQENKGKVDSVKKNDMTMISKANGAVSNNGHGKALDATGAVAAGVGGAGLYQAGKLNGKYRRADSAGFKYAIEASGHKHKAKMHNVMMNFDDAIGETLSDHRKTAKEAAEKHYDLAEIKNSQSKKMDSIAHKLKSGRNKYAVGGAALISAAGAERAYNAKKVNKAVGANSLVMLQNRKNKKKLETVEKPVEKSNSANTAGAIAAIPVVGNYGAAGYNAHQAREGRKAAVGARTFGSSLAYGGTVGSLGVGAVMAAHTAKKGHLEHVVAHGLSNKGKAAIVVPAGLASAYGARRANKNAVKRGDIKVEKAYRRFDPEADRQRRLGLYSGAAAGSGVVLGREAARNYKVSGLDSASRAEHGLGIKLKPGLTKRGLGLTAASLAAGAISAGSYKRGVSARNQPWT